MYRRFVMKSLTALVSLFLILFSVTAFAANKTRIAVSSEGKDASAQVSAVAARCPYFLVFDEKGKLVTTLENPYNNAAGGAGSQVTGFLSGKGATVIVAGAFGPNMVNDMKAKGIRYLEFKGSVADAVKKALK
jgi:predicted Fe-Mo cluster-binding NifX family protein